MGGKNKIWSMFGLLLLGAILFFWLVKAPIISWYCTRAMGIPVSISSISIWPSETTMHEFKIKNPSGFKTRKALDVKRTRADYQFKELIADHAVIQQIEINDVDLVLEFSNRLGAANNWSVISSKIPLRKKSKGAGVTIRKLIITNLNVHILGLITGDQVKHFDRLELDDINSNSGFPTKSVLQYLFNQTDLLKYIPNSFSVPDKTIQKAKDLLNF